MHGTKRLWLWPPFGGQPAHVSHDFRTYVLAVKEREISTLLDHSLPSESALDPGDILFIPADW